MPEKGVNSLQQVPAAGSSASETSRRGSPLLVFLTVLLILVGIADVILWSIVGYYFLRGYLEGDGPVQSVSTAGAPSDDGGAGDTDALEIYIQDMQGNWDRHDEIIDRGNRLSYTDGFSAAGNTELTEQIIPAFQQVMEDSKKVTSDDPEVRELHRQFQEYEAKRLSVFEARTSGSGYDEVGINDLIEETNNMLDAYKQAIAAMAQKRGLNSSVNF